MRKPVGLNLSSELYDAIKKTAEARGTTMADLIAEVMSVVVGVDRVRVRATWQKNRQLSASHPAVAPAEYGERLGAVIRARRLTLNMTQAQVAVKAGVTYQQIHKYEKGINLVPVDRLDRIAEALETDAATLVGEAR